MAFDLIRFLDECTPSDGPWRFVGFQSDASDYKGVWFKSAVISADLVVLARRWGNGKNVYFTIGSFARNQYPSRRDPTKNITSRRGEDCVSLRSLVVDCDFKDHYPDPATAVEATAALCRATGIPPWTWTVATGGGLHFYWCFDADVPVADWQPVADAFKAVLLGRGYRCDPVVPADRARIMRLPDTRNMKPGRGQALVEAYRNPGPLIPFDLMKAPVLRMAAILPQPQSTGGGRGGGNAAKHTTERTEEWLKKQGIAVTTASPEKESDLAGQVQSGSQPADLNRIAARCLVINEALATGGEHHTEPVWKGVLSVASKCADPSQWAHKLSCRHPGYTAAATDAKLTDRMAHGPTLCRTFAQLGETKAHCARCMFRGLASQPNTPVSLGFGNNPLRFTAGLDPHADGSVWRWVNHAGKNDPPDWKEERFLPEYQFSDYTLHEFEGVLKLAFEVRRSGKAKRHEVPVTSIDDKGAFLRACAQFISPDPGDQQALIGFKRNWIETLRGNATRHVTIGDTLGWVESQGRQGFSFGDQVLWRDDMSVEPLPSNHPSQKGDKEVWLTCVRRIIDVSPLEAHVALALSAAAPLASLLNIRTAGVSLYGRSGAGKSAAMRTAAAIWGSPVVLMLAAADTPNSVGRMLAKRPGLPALHDDIAPERNKKGTVQGLLDLLFSTGREKYRLGANLSDPVVRTHCTMIGFATNSRLPELVANAAASDDAAMARLFEVVVLPVQRPDDGKDDFELLDANYGHAGPLIVRYILENEAVLKQYLAQVKSWIEKNYPDPGNVRRLIYSTAALLVVGYEIIDSLFQVNAKLHDFRKLMLSYAGNSLDDTGVVAQLARSANVVSLNRAGDEAALIWRMIGQSQIVVTNEDPATDSGANWHHDGTPIRGTVTGHRSKNTNRIYLSVPAMGQWARENGVSSRTWIELLHQHKAYLGVQNVMLGSNTFEVSASRAKCLILDYTKL